MWNSCEHVWGPELTFNWLLIQDWASAALHIIHNHSSGFEWHDQSKQSKILNESNKLANQHYVNSMNKTGSHVMTVNDADQKQVTLETNY